MKLSQNRCDEFIELLGSKSAVPGGGGAAALMGAIGTALSGMVCNLTIGKKKYIEYDDKLKGILSSSKELQNKLLIMIDEDAECFLPLSKAYGLPKETEEEIKLKEETMEKCLKAACEVPVKIIQLSYDAIKLHADLVDNCSKLAISDVGVGVQALRASLLGAQLNVIINLNSIKDQVYVNNINSITEPLVKEGIKIADNVYDKVLKAI
ncbi:MAG: cyclodeaminase/cyclohydrolase family protein [Solirubrobacterales bacterium]